MRSLKNTLLLAFLFATHHTQGMEPDYDWQPILMRQKHHPHYVRSYQDFQTEKVQWKSRYPRFEYFASRELKSAEMPKLSEYSDQLTPEFLKGVKEALGPSSHDRLPNAAKYALQLHLFVPGLDEYVVDIMSSAIFISGGRHFSEESQNFAKANKLKIASHDFLTPAQYKEYLMQPLDERGIFIGKIMEQALQNEVIGGAWKDNDLDSEALVLLHIVRTLPKALQFIYQDAKRRLTKRYEHKYDNYNPDVKKIAINRLVLGISTYYKPCHLCRNTIQGFQFRFRELVENATKRLNLPFTVNDNFGSLSLVYGQVESRNAHQSEVEDKAPAMLQSWPQITMGYHQYAECMDDRPPSKKPAVALTAAPAAAPVQPKPQAASETPKPVKAKQAKKAPQTKRGEWRTVGTGQKKG